MQCDIVRGVLVLLTRHDALLSELLSRPPLLESQLQDCGWRRKQIMTHHEWSWTNQTEICVRRRNTSSRTDGQMLHTHINRPPLTFMSASLLSDFRRTTHWRKICLKPGAVFIIDLHPVLRNICGSVASFLSLFWVVCLPSRQSTLSLHECSCIMSVYNLLYVRLRRMSEKKWLCFFINYVLPVI